MHAPLAHCNHHKHACVRMPHMHWCPHKSRSCRSQPRNFLKDAESRHDLSLNEVLTYRFQQIITGSTATKLGFVLLLCFPYVLASATFYRSLSSESWFQAIYKTYCTLFRTPGSVNRETSPGPAIVLNVVFLYGFLFFAGAVACCAWHLLALLSAVSHL